MAAISCMRSEKFGFQQSKVYVLSEGVSYEVLKENEFTSQIPSYTNGFFRLHPFDHMNYGNKAFLDTFLSKF